MKKIYIFFLWFNYALSGIPTSTLKSMQDVLIAEHHLDGNQFCNYVYRRYYFIKRLQTTMLLFVDVENRIKQNDYKSKQLDGLFNFAQIANFKDMRIQRSVDVMQQKRSLKPLFMIWQEFTGYKSIKDQIFVEEFTKEVFIISRNMLINLAAHDDFVVAPPFRSDASCEQLLADIDYMTELYQSIMQNNKNVPFSRLERAQLYRTHCARSVDLHTFAHVDDVMMRYYIIKRLSPAYAHMALVPYQVPTTSLVSWHHPLIISCLRVMEQSSSLEPLISLWDDVVQYKYIQDDLFMHEFAQLILIIYTNAMQEYLAKGQVPTKDPLTTALAVYQMIDKLPLQEILDAIDIITHDLPPLLEKYELDSDLSWNAWFKKYWWAPPLIVITIAAHIVLNWEAKKMITNATTPQSVSQAAPTSNSTHDDLGDYKWLDLFYMNAALF